MSKVFENTNPFESAVEKFESNHGSFNAKDPKHEGKICDYLDEEIDWLESKPLIDIFIVSNLRLI